MEPWLSNKETVNKSKNNLTEESVVKVLVRPVGILSACLSHDYVRPTAISDPHDILHKLSLFIGQQYILYTVYIYITNSF